MRRSAALVAAVGLLAGILPSSALAAAPPNREANGEPVQVIVRFSEPPGRAAHDAIRATGGTVRHTYRRFPLVAAAVPERALEGLRRNPLVESVELDGRLVAFDHGPDTGDLEYENAWGVEHIGTPAVHAAGIRGAGIQVAVIDTGIDYIHDQPPSAEPPVVDPEFLGNYVGGEDFTSETEFGPMTLDGDPMDDNGHGTHVSGTLAAEKNGYLVSGVAPEVDLFALKILRADGTGWYSNLIAALEWIIDYNVAHPGAGAIDVVNMSVGSHDVSAELANAISATAATGTILVAASGNVDPFNWEEVFYGCDVAYPAAYPEVFATTFTNQNNALTGPSCTGPEVDFASPGEGIASPVPVGDCMLCSPDGYMFLDGTSMASPHLAGTVALLLDAGLTDQGSPGLHDDVRDALCDAADLGYGVQTGYGNTPIPPSDPRYREYFGCGVVDADGAVLGLGPPPPANAAPVAGDDSASTAEDAPVSVSVLGNDTDADGDPLSVAAVTQPANGVASIEGSTVRYEPAANYNGADSFTYTVSDGRGGSDTATVSLAVTPVPDAPVAAGDSASTAEDAAVTIAVLANDSDADGDALTASVVTGPSHGTAVVDGSGIRYAPAANYSGADSFTYAASDGSSSSTATVSMTVTPVNDIPTADPKSVTATAGVGTTIGLSGSDVETCELAFTIVDLPDHGGVGSASDFACGVGTPNTDSRTLVYTADGSWSGPDSFSYRVNDGAADSPTVTVSISVTGGSPPPPPPPTVHVGDLDGSSSTQSRSWTAVVTVAVHTGADAPAAGAVVTGSWTGSGSGGTSCTTSASGVCTLTRTGIPKKTTQVTFTVTNVALSGSTYQQSSNHDPDGSSNGTAIVVRRA